MRIISSPDFEVITCEKCGTVFQPEPFDHLEYLFSATGLFPQRILIRCPVCDKHCDVKIAEK